MALVKSDVWMDVNLVLNFKIEHEDNLTPEQVNEKMHSKTQEVELHIENMIKSDSKYKDLYVEATIGDTSIFDEDTF